MSGPYTLRAVVAALSGQVGAEVVDGPERVVRQAAARSRVVVTETQDNFGPPKTNSGENPRQLVTRQVGLDIMILGVSNKSGAKPADHRERALDVLHAVVRELYLYAHESHCPVTFATGAFTPPEDPTIVETRAEYHLQVSVGEAIRDVAWNTATGVAPDGSTYLVTAGVVGDESGCA